MTCFYCQGSHWKVTGKSPGSHREVTMKSPGSHREVIGKSPGSHRKVTRKSLGSHQEITGMSPGNPWKVTGKSWGSHQEVTEKSLGSHREVTQKSLRSHQEVTGESSGGQEWGLVTRRSLWGSHKVTRGHRGGIGGQLLSTIFANCTTCSWKTLTMLNPQLVVGKHGFFGDHLSKDIRTIFVVDLWLGDKA